MLSHYSGNPWMRGLVQDVTIPALGMAMTGAVLTRWYKEPGETVAAGEAIAEIETDKSAVDLESPADGMLGPHLVAAGDEVPVGAAVTRIMDSQPEPEPDYEPDPFPVPADTGGGGAAAGGGAAPEIGASGTSGAGTTGGVSAAGVTFPHARRPHALSPRKRMAARLAAEAAAAAQADGARMDGPRADEALTGRRRAVAQAVTESWRTIPHFSVQREI